MPKRILFNVIYATSEAPCHPASELGVAGPASRGWRSAPGARAPHDLVLQLQPARAAITRVQILAHQHLIPERIELLVHDASCGSRTPSSPQYCMAGWVSLAAPGAGARELRTAAVPARAAKYVRLRLAAPHPSHHNPDGQVSLMGVNIFGVELPELDPSKEAGGAETEAALGALPELVGDQHYSPYDDLAFIMYVDPHVADIIRQLETKKQAAILAERFEYARKLKCACGVLGAGGRMLGALQLQKRLAAQAEQYERATRRRDAITQARARLAEAVKLDVLMEPDGVDPRNDEYSTDDIPFSIEMLSQPTSKLSFDAPSPSPSSRPPETDSKPQHCERQLPKHSEPPANHQVKRVIMDENRIYFVNGSQESLCQKSVENTKAKYYTEPNKNLEYENRVNSPCKSEGFQSAEHVRLREVDGGKINYHGIPNGDESSYLYDREDHNANRSGSVGNGKDLNDYAACGRSKVVEESLFNSPANSVSPTNLSYAAEGTVNFRVGTGVAPPATPGGPTIVVKRRNRSAGPPPPAHHRSSYEAYEERTVPALRHSHTNEYLRGCQGESPSDSRIRSKLGERERKQAALPILIFGEHLVEKIYSKHFAEKEEGLQTLKSELHNFGSKTSGTSGAAQSPNKAARAATLLLHRALRDPVFSVYCQAAEVTRIFFTDFIVDRVNAAEVSRSVERLVPELLTRAGEPAPRVHSLAMHTLLTMADCPTVRSLGLIPSYLVRPLTAGTAPRLALSRLLMVEQLLLNHGLDKTSGLRARAVAELGAGGLTHGQGAVRRAAERLLLAGYERAPRLVRAQLPPDDPVTRRNLLYRHLFEGFDRIDRRKQEELMGNSQCEDVSLGRSGQFMNGMNPKMMESSMSMSQMSSSFMTSSMTSSMSSSMTASIYQPRSSMKKQSSRKHGTVGFNGIKNDVEYPGYNKLRLDSAVSPKHQPKVNKSSQNPRTYVLEKNWQNSVMQNGNHCPQIENKSAKGSTSARCHSNYDDIPENIGSMSKSITFSNSSLNCLPSSKQGSVTSLNTLNSVQNGTLHPYHKSGMVARNLQSNIVFDNSRSNYADEESLTNGLKKMQMTECNKSSSETLCNDKVSVNGSPVGSLKRIKNRNIYRSKSGSNMPTCFNDDNFDSFDDSQMDVDSYDCYSKGDDSRREMLTQDDHLEVADAQVDYHSDASTPEVGDKEGEGQCPFCLGCVAPGGLDSHYWRSCPLLGRCPACRAPLELRSLSQHLTEDCPQSSGHQMCDRCTEAVPAEDFDKHSAENYCLETLEDFWKCPLCHANVPGDEDSWRQHLTGQDLPQGGCPSNPRASHRNTSPSIH